jgi:hypothetical protein
MKNTELDLLLSHFDNLHKKIDASNENIKSLDEFIREHMKNEEVAMHLVDKRISKLEWKANSFATVFGLVGGLVSSKIYAIFGIKD